MAAVLPSSATVLITPYSDSNFFFLIIHVLLISHSRIKRMLWSNHST